MNQFQEIFDKQKAYFDSDATKSYEWRIDQLTRLETLCNENAEALEAAMSSDFRPQARKKSSRLWRQSEPPPSRSKS
jgi:aldehyde dehydrogenase (NAD+)